MQKFQETSICEYYIRISVLTIHFKIQINRNLPETHSKQDK